MLLCVPPRLRPITVLPALLLVVESLVDGLLRLLASGPDVGMTLGATMNPRLRLLRSPTYRLLLSLVVPSANTVR